MISSGFMSWEELFEVLTMPVESKWAFSGHDWFRDLFNLVKINCQKVFSPVTLAVTYKNQIRLKTIGQ